MICLIPYLISLLCSIDQVAAEEMYRFRVYLNHKPTTGYSIDKPEEFLSDEAISRRKRFHIPITLNDIPIVAAVIDSVCKPPIRPVVSSKWMNTLVVECADSSDIRLVADSQWVDSVRWVWKGNPQKEAIERGEKELLSPDDKILKSSLYGYANKQIQMLRGEKLHKKGFRGEGMRVAVIDAGFLNVDRMEVFSSLNLLGTHNIVFPGETVYDEDEHGTRVLSCLAAYLPGIMVGTAPDAAYLLIKSEDVRSEYPIEEDYWIAAVEYADSMGVDVISTSLGYYRFDDRALSYRQEQLDGQTAHISRAAQTATDKGLLLISSAGNEGNSEWEKITFPSDVDNLLTVGAINMKKKKSSFSSIGFAADGRIKPDVVALGTATCIIDGTGNLRHANGTSFAAPTVAGLAICLRQAMPDLSVQEIIRIIIESADRYKRPTTELGYGIPNFYKAYKKNRKHVRKSN